MSRHDIRGKTIIIAGGAKNLGGLLARDLAAQGAAAIAIHYNSEASQRDAGETAAAVEAAGAKAITVQGDLTSAVAVAQLFDKTVAAFGQLVSDGLVRYTAVSNYSAERIRAWVRIARDLGVAEPVAIQPHYNLVHRETENDIVPVADMIADMVAEYTEAVARMDKSLG